MLDQSLNNLIQSFAALPGLGSRSAKRIVLYLCDKKQNAMLPLAKAIEEAAHKVKNCTICNNLDTSDPCEICTDPARDKKQLCVVAHVADLWAMERTRAYKGHYHVLGGVLSALDGVGPEDLDISKLISRIEENSIQEVILALALTVDGQSTAHYIMDQLSGKDITVTKLAQGVPVGGELDYLDDGTITTALKARSKAS